MERHKNLNRNSRKIDYLMKKRGLIQVFAVISFIVVAGAIMAGSYLINKQPSDFVGDASIKKYYDIECLPKVSQDKRILFQSEEIAKKLNFTYSTC